MAPDTTSKPLVAQWRLAALLAVTLGMITWLVVTDDGEIRTLARCMVLGEGRAWVSSPGQTGEEFEADYFGYRFRGNTKHFLDRHVKLFGGYEKPVLFFMRDAAQALDLDDGVFVDVGAHVGTHAMFMSKHVRMVHAVEPYPPVLRRLEEHVEINQIDNIFIHPVGYSDAPGELPFFEPDQGNPGAGSFDGGMAQQNEDKGMVLPLLPGDEHLAETGVDEIDLLKVDIEGFEKPAFQGLRRTMKRDRPLVVFELNVANEQGFHSEKELRATFPKNYEFFELQTRPDFKWVIGDNWLVCRHEVGEYWLRPYDMTLGRRVNAVAVPSEDVDALLTGVAHR